MPTTGTYENADGQPLVRFERTFPHPVETVWEAITDPAQLGQWFPTTVQFERLGVGEPLEFHFEHDAYPPMNGRVLEVQRPQRLRFTWGDDVLGFELEPADGGAACRLAFTVALDSADKAARDGAGWEQCLDGLELVTAGGHPQRPMPSAAWQAYYDEYMRAGAPATAPLLPQP